MIDFSPAVCKINKVEPQLLSQRGQEVLQFEPLISLSSADEDHVICSKATNLLTKWLSVVRDLIKTQTS